MDAFLGLDAGGTRTRAVIVDADGTVLGCGSGPAANPNNRGMAAAVAVLSATATEAQTQSAATALRTCFIGLAGIKTASDAAAVESALRGGGFPATHHLVVANDTEAALAGGLAGQPGVALIAGTGSFCLGRNAEGVSARCGGWGWLLDDIGSGFWLGHEALHAIALAADGRGPVTTLTDAVLGQLGLTTADGLLGVLYPDGATPHAVARWAPMVLEHASRGDAVARGITNAGARGLAELVGNVACQLQWSHPPAVVLTGGVVESGVAYREQITIAIAQLVSGATVTTPQLPPVAGAALRALEEAGIKVTPPIVARLQATLPARL